MKQASTSTATEQALEAINTASWERQRSTNELRQFLSRREAAVADIQL